MTLFAVWQYRPDPAATLVAAFPKGNAVLVRTTLLLAFSASAVACSAAEETGTSAKAETDAHRGSIAATVATRSVAPRPWKYLVVHHSATSGGSVESIDRAHKQRVDSNGNPWRGIGYHFVVGNGSGMADGVVAPTFRWTRQIEGAHAGSREHNDLGIGICLIGNFENVRPTEKQIQSLQALLAELREQFHVAGGNIIAHGDIRATACPGKLFPRERFLTAQSSSQAPHQTAYRGGMKFRDEPSCDWSRMRRPIQMADALDGRKESQ